MASMGADERSQPSAVKARHVEVEEDQAGPQRIPEALHRVNPIDGGDYGAAEGLETLGEPTTEFGVVIHNQNATLARHAGMLVLAAWECHREGRSYRGVNADSARIATNSAAFLRATRLRSALRPPSRPSSPVTSRRMVPFGFSVRYAPLRVDVFSEGDFKTLSLDVTPGTAEPTPLGRR